MQDDNEQIKKEIKSAVEKLFESFSGDNFSGKKLAPLKRELASKEKECSINSIGDTTSIS